jgi:type III secretion system YscD/HrpQ family protein
MSDTGDWILKVISGPHQGAEIALKPGRIVVGSHADCDLVLHDVLVAAQHFALTLEKGVLTLEALEGRVFNQGRRVEAKSTVPAFAFVTAGTTHLVAGPAAARWPLLSAADVPELEKEAPPPAEKKPDAPAAEAAAAEAAARDGTPSPAQRKRALFAAGFGGVMLLVWLVLWLWWRPAPPAPPAPDVRERAEQVLKSFPEASALRLEVQGNQLIVTGYLDSDSAHREITTALREQAPEVTQRVWSNARVLESAQAFLAERRLGLEAVAAGPGALKVSGSLRTPADWARVRQLLLAEIAGLERVEDDITFVGIAPTATPRPDASATTRARAPEPAAPLLVVALRETGDGHGWIRLSDGSVLFRGARLANGARLVDVRAGNAILEKGARRYGVTLGADFDPARWTPLPAEGAPERPAPTVEPPTGEGKPAPPNG